MVQSDVVSSRRETPWAATAIVVLIDRIRAIFVAELVRRAAKAEAGTNLVRNHANGAEELNQC